MSPERWRQITDLFEAALERGAAERGAFLDAACGGDEELRREVEAMLASHEGAPDFMEEPGAAAASLPGGGASLVGQALAHYRVVSRLGSGGMGDVYLAEDTRLGRRVALKLLPDYLAGDERRARMFTREARAASALSHPSIVTVYDVGRWGGRYFIAMEYVEGVTLGERIHRARDPLPKLLNYLQQAAEGLAKAHAAGIVHRDLKPDNIMVTRDGFAKVLDFGLAKRIERPGDAGGAVSSEAATAMLAPESLPGMVMGTVGYMSPEQALGRVHEIDHRSDIFSFGCILYEAATGRKAFAGADVPESLNKIIRETPAPVTELNPDAPAGLERVARRCLHKDPERRYQSIKDVAIELDEIGQELRGRAETRPPAPHASADGARVTGAAGGAAPAAASSFPDGAGLMMTARDQSSPQAQVWHVSYPEGSARRVTNDLNEYQGMSLSADGRTVVVAQSARATDLWVMPGDGRGEALRVTTGVGKADGNWGISWTPDGKIIYGSNASGSRDLWLLDPQTGAQKQLTKDARQNYYPAVMPDGRSVLFLSDRGDEFDLWRVDIDGGNPVQLIAGNIVRFAVSPDGQWIAYSSAGPKGIPALWRARIDGSQRALVNDECWEEISSFSPDGRGIAFQYFQLGAGGLSFGQVPLEGGPVAKIGEPPFRVNTTLRWTPDGRAVAYIDNRGDAGQLSALPAGGGPPKQLTDFKSDYLYWFDWSRDGRQLAVARGTTVSDAVLISNVR